MTQIVLESLLRYVAKYRRVCPTPLVWNELWQLLSNRNRRGAGWSPPPPLVLGSRYFTTDDEKIVRLALHIRYAHENGGLGELDKFLRTIEEDAWVHRGDA